MTKHFYLKYFFNKNKICTICYLKACIYLGLFLNHFWLPDSFLQNLICWRCLTHIDVALIQYEADAWTWFFNVDQDKNPFMINQQVSEQIEKDSFHHEAQVTSIKHYFSYECWDCSVHFLRAHFDI